MVAGGQGWSTNPLPPHVQGSPTTPSPPRLHLQPIFEGIKPYICFVVKLFVCHRLLLIIYFSGSTAHDQFGPRRQVPFFKKQRCEVFACLPECVISVFCLRICHAFCVCAFVQEDHLHKGAGGPSNFDIVKSSGSGGGIVLGSA